MSEFLSRYGALLLDGTLESLYMTLVLGSQLPDLGLMVANQLHALVRQ